MTARTPLAWLSHQVWRLEHAFEQARARSKPEDETPFRIFFVLSAFAAVFMLLAVGAAKAALFSDAGARRAGGPGGIARADLTDRNGLLLAADMEHFGVYLDMAQVWDRAETAAVLRAALPTLSPRRLAEAIHSEKRSFLVGGLTPEQKGRLQDLGLPGLAFEPEPRRVYPAGATAAHLVGFSDRGGQGVQGAERALDTVVRGTDQPNALSIDLRVQAALEDELQRAAQEFQVQGAVGLVTDVHTGEVLGLASYPDFDPNTAGRFTPEQRLNRAAATVFEMGSTFKTFTVAAGLDAGVATPTSTYDATRPIHVGYRTVKDYHAANQVLTLVEVFQHSSNIGTYKIAAAVGAERMHRYFDGFGLTRRAAIELKESTRPLTPAEWNEDALVSNSFGHGVNVSPVALAAAMGAVLNGGELKPLTIRKLAPGAQVAGSRVLSQATSRQMLDIMRANVTGGSGGKADVPGLTVGGKTGTGEKYDPAIRRYNGKRQVSSFAAVFPTAGALEDRRYFVLILMDEPKGNAKTFGFSTGGWVAAPAAGRVIDRIAPFLKVKRQAEAFPTAGLQLASATVAKAATPTVASER